MCNTTPHPDHTTKTPCPRCGRKETPYHLKAWDGLCQVCWETVTAHDTFSSAASSMTQEDWDHDNAWLASAGWGEM